MITDEQRKRLSPEQLAIVEQWEKEREERSHLYDELSVAEKAKDTAKFKEILGKLSATTSDRCPHDRSIWSSCAGCSEIERLMNPERYCSKCENELDEDEPPFVQGMCDYCSQVDTDE